MTDRQQKLLDFLRAWQTAQSVPPSTREIARHFDVAQPTVLQHLQALARQGHVEKLSDGKWGFSSAAQSQLFEIPVYGAIPAGLPAQQEQDPEDTIRIDPAVFGVRRFRPGNFWFLRVTGDSMTGARIFDGDLVGLVRRDPKPGDIIAALVDDTTTTLKRFIKERGRILLRAANPRFADIFPTRLESQGVLVGVLRRTAGRTA